MKKLSLILAIFVSVFFTFTACNKDEATPTDENIVPENFSVDVPSSISKPASTQKSTSEDKLRGNEIYEHLTTFIHVGEEAAQIVEDIIQVIRQYNLSQAMSFSFTSEDDGSVKNVDIIENSTFENKTWQFQLTIVDDDSKGNEDGGIAIQVFWNNNPVDGIAILKPANIDKTNDDLHADAMYRVDYSEAGLSYEQQMTVYISGLTMPDAALEPYAISTLKMTVGKNGDNVSVFGNSNHPNAVLFTENKGFNWAFVAAGSETSDIGVAEVGLPPCELNSNSRKEILEDYSIKNVFTLEVKAYWAAKGVTFTDEQIAPYLENADAPGYFGANGFVKGGVAPSTEYTELESIISSLAPFNPYQVSGLTVQFKKELQ